MGAFTRELKQDIWQRDGSKCCRCGHAVWQGDVHHRRGRGSGGRDSHEEWIDDGSNLILVCRDCHDWIEFGDPALAKSSGLRLTHGQLPSDTLFYSEHERMWFRVYFRDGTHWRDPYSGLLAPYAGIPAPTYSQLSGQHEARSGGAAGFGGQRLR